jgi:methyl-accepting chemotaxis protein
MSAILPEDNARIAESANLCARGLDGLGDRFLKSFHGCEQDFLRLGKALDGFNTAAVVVSREASDLAELTAGDAVGNASAKLASNLDRLGRECENAIAGQDITNLDAIAEVGSKLTASIRDFTRLVKHLTMLGIATRIESARLGSHGLGFSTLADDVEKLAGKIASSSEVISRRALELTSQCHEASVSLADMDQARKACSLSALDLLASDLDALDSLTESSRKTAAEIAEEAAGMVHSVSAAVLSMQFHDIIRQQLEHVAEAAQEAKAMAVDGPQTQGGHDAQDWEELAGWMRSVLVLQQSQLGNAKERFSEAMQSLGASLRDIAMRVQSMASQAGSVANQESGQEGVLGQIEAEVRGISQSLRDYAGLQQKMASVMNEVGNSIRDMSSSVSEIEEVGSEIELIALNASVKAAHTGEEGKALGVLASAIQKLSVDARGQTDTIMELLASVDSTSLALIDINKEIAGGNVFEEAVAELDNEVANLKSLGERSAFSASRVQGLASQLSGEIENTVETLEFQQKLIGSMSEAETLLRELVQELDSVLPAGAPLSQSPKLREMLDRYTMDAERLVHENALGITMNASAEQEDGEFGGNVELF